MSINPHYINPQLKDGNLISWEQEYVEHDIRHIREKADQRCSLKNVVQNV